MADERNGTERLDLRERDAEDEILTPAMRQLLGNLALNVQTHTELADAFKEIGRTMDLLVERHPEFAGPAAELRAKMAQLQDLHGWMGIKVMRYSNDYEDSVTAKSSVAERPGGNPPHAER